MSGIQGIAGVILWTDQWEEMVSFYRDTLGLAIHSLHNDFAAFELRPGMRLSIGRHSQVHGPAGDPHRIMVNLAVGDIQRTHRELAEKGVQFIRPPEREVWGGWVATFRDPDGNILQLLQHPSG